MAATPRHHASSPSPGSRRGVLAAFAARPLPLLVLWAVPALAIAAVPLLVGRWVTAPPVPAGGLPTIGGTVQAVLALAAQLFPQLFLLVLFAGPAGVLVAGGDLRVALRRLPSISLVGVAVALALWQTAALLLTLLPGLLALQASPLMALIFLGVGTIGGAAAAVAVFARWMYAPTLVAAHGLGATEALDTSQAHARAQGNFGAALGLAVLFGILAFLSSAVGAVAHAVVAPGEAAAMAAGGGTSAGAGGASLRGLAASTLGAWVVLWPGLAIVTSAVAARLEAFLAGGAAPAGRPTLALRSRPSRCPRCGALVAVPVVGEAPLVRCLACGLEATLR